MTETSLQLNRAESGSTYASLTMLTKKCAKEMVRKLTDAGFYASLSAGNSNMVLVNNSQADPIQKWLNAQPTLEGIVRDAQKVADAIRTPASIYKLWFTTTRWTYGFNLRTGVKVGDKHRNDDGSVEEVIQIASPAI